MWDLVKKKFPLIIKMFMHAVGMSISYHLHTMLSRIWHSNIRKQNQRWGEEGTKCYCDIVSSSYDRKLQQWNLNNENLNKIWTLRVTLGVSAWMKENTQEAPPPWIKTWTSWREREREYYYSTKMSPLNECSIPNGQS